MTPSQTCKSCSETRPVQAFERLSSGGYRGTCIACRQAAGAARKRQHAQERRATPEHQAKLNQKRLAKEESAARKETERAARAALAAELVVQREAQRLQAIEQARLAVREREATLRDDIWDAMRTGRYRRAATAIRPHQTATHRIKLAHGGGFISIAELACRCVEREATGRAASTCKTFESAAAASRILERATATLDRRKEVGPLWRGDAPQTILGGPSDDPDINEDDLFEEAFGDWAPSWAATAASSWPASRAG